MYHIKMLIVTLFGDLHMVYYVFYFIKLPKFYNELKFCLNGIEFIFQFCYMSRATLKQRSVRSWMPYTS